MMRVLLFLVLLGAVLAALPSSVTKCGDGANGRCEIYESGFRCDGGWGGGKDPCQKFTVRGEREYRCCKNPVPCTLPNYGKGKCIAGLSCDVGLLEAARECPSGTKCCAKADPPTPCAPEGRQPGLCLGADQQCSGVKMWGPCGLNYRYCCTSPPITHGPPAPVKPTDGPPGPPTYGPPAPTVDPGSGLFSLVPAVTAGAYLGGVDNEVEFRAMGDQLKITFVDFYVNEAFVGHGRRCVDGFTWCYQLNFKNIKSASVLKAKADAGSSVSYQIPLIKPNWIMRFLRGSPVNANDWAGTYSMTWLQQKGSAGMLIPVVGFTHSWEMNVQSTMKLEKGGKITVSGNGNRIDTFKPDCCVEATGTISVSASMTSNLIDIGGLVKEPQISEARLTVSGSVQMPTVYQFSKEFTFLGFTVGVEAAIDVLLGTSSTLKYVRDDGADLFGLPLRFSSFDGVPLSLGADARAQLMAGPLTAAVVAQAVISPHVSWTAEKGLQWNGVTVDAKLYVNVDFYFSTARVDLIAVSVSAKRGVGRVGDAKINNFTRIANIWDPVVTSIAAPFRIDNVYPSPFTGTASIHGYDVLVWSSFDAARSSPNDLQVQYAYRRHNGAWSQPLFVSGSQTSVGMPVLEDIESQSKIILVASAVVNSSVAEGALEAQLVYSFFDLDTQSWSAYQPLFAAPPRNTVDWLPVFSETGLWLAFIRATKPGASLLASGQLMASHLADGRWTAPEVVVEDSSLISAFSLDASLDGSAMLAYRTQESSKVNLCSYAAGWTCQNTDYDLASSSAPSLLYTHQAYLLIWAVGDTIFSVKLSTNGSHLNSHSLKVSSPVNILVTTISDMAGPGSAIVGWTTWNKNSTFSYAVADPSGALRHSPKNVAPQLSGREPGTVAPGSMQLAWTGAQLLYATMFSDNSTSARGTLVSYDLTFDADAALSSPVFEPADFSSPVVSLTVTLTNVGLTSIAAGGSVFFTFVTASDMEYVMGVVQHPDEIPSGQSIPVTLQWDTTVNTTEGGTVRVDYFGVAAVMAKSPLYIDPASYLLGNISITSGSEPRSTVVAGFLEVTGPSIAEVQLQAWTRLDDSALLLLGSIKHRPQPRDRKPFYIPLTNLSAVFDNIQVRVIGLHYKSSIFATAYDERYDFSLSMADIRIRSTGFGKFAIDLPVRNLGSADASVSLRVHRLNVMSGAEELLLATLAQVNGRSSTNVAFELELPMQLNMLRLRLNSDDQPLPELNSDNNEVLISVHNSLGTPERAENDWTLAPSSKIATPMLTSDILASTTAAAVQEQAAASSRHVGSHPNVLIAIVVVCVALAITLILVAVVLLRSKSKSDSYKMMFAEQ